jgi:hypothetical protein
MRGDRFSEVPLSFECFRRPFRTELFFDRNQTLRVWLISGCPFRTNKDGPLSLPHLSTSLLSHSFCLNSLTDDLQCWLGFNLSLLTSSPTEPDELRLQNSSLRENCGWVLRGDSDKNLRA